MHKATKSTRSRAPNGPPTRRSAESHRAALAYLEYSRKALLRFDLEAQIETIRQQRAGLSLSDAIGDANVGEHVRSMIRDERKH